MSMCLCLVLGGNSRMAVGTRWDLERNARGVLVGYGRGFSTFFKLRIIW